MLPAMVRVLPRHSTILRSMLRMRSDLGWAGWRLPLVLAGPQPGGWDVGSHSEASQCGSSLGSPNPSRARLSPGIMALEPEDSSGLCLAGEPLIKVAGEGVAIRLRE